MRLGTGSSGGDSERAPRGNASCLGFRVSWVSETRVAVAEHAMPSLRRCHTWRRRRRAASPGQRAPQRQQRARAKEWPLNALNAACLGFGVYLQQLGLLFLSMPCGRRAGAVPGDDGGGRHHLGGGGQRAPQRRQRRRRRARAEEEAQHKDPAVVRALGGRHGRLCGRRRRRQVQEPGWRGLGPAYQAVAIETDAVISRNALHCKSACCRNLISGEFDTTLLPSEPQFSSRARNSASKGAQSLAPSQNQPMQTRSANLPASASLLGVKEDKFRCGETEDGKHPQRSLLSA